MVTFTEEILNGKLHFLCSGYDARVCNYKQRWNKDNVNVNVKNWLIKVVVIKDLFGILLIEKVNVINHVMLENI